MEIQNAAVDEVTIFNFVDTTYTIIQTAFAAFYVGLTLLASMTIESISEDVRAHSPNLSCVTDFRIRQWQRSYSSIMNLIEEINAFFGPFLVAFFTEWFLMASFDLFDLLERWMKSLGVVLFSTIYILWALAIIETIILATQRMKTKVIQLDDLMYAVHFII